MLYFKRITLDRYSNTINKHGDFLCTRVLYFKILILRFKFISYYRVNPYRHHNSGTNSTCWSNKPTIPLTFIWLE